MADPGVLQAGLVQARELVFVRARHVALGLVVFVAVYCVFYDLLGGETS